MLLTAAVTVLLLGVSGYAQDASGALSADDFLAEAQGGNTKIAAPADISVKGDVVTAATMQDAANKATELTVKESSNYTEDDPAFMLITSKKGGVGAIATGRASYATTARNKDAVRLAMRHAYIKAFMEAKKNLTVGFNGLSSEGKTVLVNALRTIVNDDETLKNSKTGLEEVITQWAEGFIKGYEIRQVKDIPEESSIVVTISVNGKSLGKFARTTPAVVESADLKTGLTQVFDEIQKGLVLPAGGRVIMTAAGDACYVGYGSALIRDDSDPEMRVTLMNDARRIATTRAFDSLTGLVRGDAVIWESGVSEKHVRELKDFEDVIGNDATADQSPEGIKKLAERKKAVLTSTETNETTQSIRRGVLPPGISPRTFRDKDNVWYYAVVVYNPSMTQAASDLAKEMQNAVLIPPGGSGGSAAQPNVPRPGAEIQMIPTGAFDDDE